MIDFQVWDSAGARDRTAWIERWKQWPGREVFAHPDYVQLYAGPHIRSVCLAASFEGSNVLYPFLLRSVGGEPYCDASLRDYTDIVTPYGYGGPFGWGPSWRPDALRAFWMEFDAWAARSRVVSEFVRFSLFSETLVEYPGERSARSENVIRTLDREEGLWRDFEHKVRKNVNRARTSGVTVRMDEAGEGLDDFLAIYADTMSRRGAQESYYFPREYFERMRADLQGQFALFHADVGGRVVSSELVLISADRIYSFLGGTDAAWFHVRPNDLLKLEIMNWAHSIGKVAFVLGGGYANGDGIYRYKRAFAPTGSVSFTVGQRIFADSAYQALVSGRQRLAASQGLEWSPSPGYFPEYRG